MMSLEELFVNDTAAFADPLHFVIEARSQVLDLQLESFVGAHATWHLPAAAAAAVEEPVVGLASIATKSVTSSVGMTEVDLADLGLTINLMYFVEVAAAFEPCSVAANAWSADLIACLSYLTEFHAFVEVQKHYFEVLTAAAANLIGCFAEPCAAAMAETACSTDYSAAHATLIVVAAVAACPQHWSAAQLMDSAACLKNLFVD